jgi:GAF domain-containing protein
VGDAVRESFARERRWSQLTLTVETERERRQEAEAMRAVLEGIVHQARFEETIEEVLKQLARIVTFDSCSLALIEPGGRFRIVAARGFEEPARLIGLHYKDALSDAIRSEHQALALADVLEDERYQPLEPNPEVRSWAGIPLLVEGEVIGLIALDRRRVEPFDEEELHRAKAVAFSAAAAIRKARLLDQVQRYASLQEWLVSLYEEVLDGKPADLIGQHVLEGALRMGYAGGAIVGHAGNGRATVVAALGEGFDGASGHAAPKALLESAARRIDLAEAPALGAEIGAKLEAEALYLVPIATPDERLGSLILLDPGGETASDALTEAYASRAALAWRHALHRAKS